jgi:hypothetical protein
MGPCYERTAISLSIGPSARETLCSWRRYASEARWAAERSTAFLSASHAPGSHDWQAFDPQSLLAVGLSAAMRSGAIAPTTINSFTQTAPWCGIPRAEEVITAVRACTILVSRLVKSM